MSRPTEFIPDFALSPITPYGNGTFERAGAGPAAVIMAVEDSRGIYDRVAWYPGQPRTWWLEHGFATVLGDEAIDAARWHGEPVLMVATPADWITARGQAVCILDWSADVYVPLSLAPGGVKCATPALADKLRKALARPRIAITVAQARRHAA